MEIPVLPNERGMRVKISLAAAAALVALGSATVVFVPAAAADPGSSADCGPGQTTAVVTEYGGRLAGIPFVSCVPVSTVTSGCFSEPGVPHKRLYEWYPGAPVECKSVYNT